MDKDEHQRFKEQLDQAIDAQENASGYSVKSLKNFSQKLQGQNIAMKILGDLIAGVIVGLGLGLGLDHLLGTKPLFSAILSPLGVFIGMYTTIRYTLKAHLDEKKEKNN